MKKLIIIPTSLLFMLSTLIMPYANFDDVTSLKVVYNHFLSTDEDLNLIEFIGEKLFFGIDETENNEPKTDTNKPIPLTTAIVQIQSGVLFQPNEIISILVNGGILVNIKTPIRNQNFAYQKYQSCIFRPPSILG